MRKFSFILIVKILFVIILGFNGTFSPIATSDPNYTTNSPINNQFTNKITEENDWLFLVYIAADNDLEEFAIMDINELEYVDYPSNVKVVVQVDRHEDYDVSNDDWTGTRRYLIKKEDPISSNINSQMIDDMGEQNMGAPNVLRDFVSWGMVTFPATHTALILWDHGNGWSNEKTYDAEELFFEDTKSNMVLSERIETISNTVEPVKKTNIEKTHETIQKVVCSDDYDNDVLTINEIQLALTGIHLDIIGIDACLMGTIEIAYEFSNHADYYIASEENIPGYGWPYTEIVQHIATNSNLAPGAFASLIVDDYITSYRAGGLYHVEDATLSAFNLTMMDSIVEETNSFFEYLLDNKENYELSEVAISIDECSSYYLDQIDYLSFIHKLKENLGSVMLPQLDILADNLISVLQNAVVNAEYNEEHPDALSMSIFAPKYKENYLLAYEYACDDWTTATMYDEFIKEFSSNFGSVFDFMQPITAGTYSGQLNEGDYIYYKFTTAETQTRITVTLDFDFINDFDLRLYDENYVIIDYSFYNNPEFVTGFSFESTTFAIIINSYSGSGSFNLEINEFVSISSNFDFEISDEIIMEEIDLDGDLKYNELIFTIPIEITSNSQHIINYVFTTNENSEKIYCNSLSERMDDEITEVILRIPSLDIYKLNLTATEEVTLHLQLKNSVGDILDRSYNATTFVVTSEDYQTPVAFLPNLNFNPTLKKTANGINIGLPIYVKEYGMYTIEFSVYDLTKERVSYITVNNYLCEETSINSLQIFNLTIPAALINSYFDQIYYFDDFLLIKNNTNIDWLDFDFSFSQIASSDDFIEKNLYGVTWRTSSTEGLVIWDLSLATDDTRFIYINYYMKIDDNDWQEIIVEEDGYYKIADDEFNKDLQLKFEITLTALGEIESYEILSPILVVEKSSNAPGFVSWMVIFSLLSLSVFHLLKGKKNFQ